MAIAISPSRVGMAMSKLRQLDFDCSFFGVCVLGLDFGGSRLAGALVWVVFCGLDKALLAGAGARWVGAGVWVVFCGLDGALLAGTGSCLMVFEV